jgi:4,5-dihydroxyphthalate decarboxylase
MAEPKLILGFREPDIDTNRPFVEGRVKVEGFELEITAYRGPESVDAWDASFGGLMQTKGKGDHPFVSIPAFPNRKFRLSYIFVNSAAGIESPRDLEGKRVFVSSTAGIWARGALRDYYEVDFTRVNWVMPDAEAGSWAPGVSVEALPQAEGSMEERLDALLLSGELDAVIEPNVLPSIFGRDPRVRRLFADYKREEQGYFKATGIFPISHMVTLKREFVDRHPNAPVALLKAYRQARDVAFKRVDGSDPEYLVISWASALLEEQRALMGEDYWAYNVDANRRSLEAMMSFAHTFGVTPARLDYESFFDPEAAALPGV